MNYNFPLFFFDPPVILQANVTNIPGSGSLPLQVVADSGFKSCVAIDFIDTTGDYIGVYQGAAGQETLACVIGGGLNSRAWALFPAHCRVSLRSMTASAITNGSLMCSFMSY